MPLCKYEKVYKKNNTVMDGWEHRVFHYFLFNLGLYICAASKLYTRQKNSQNKEHKQLLYCVEYEPVSDILGQMYTQKVSILESFQTPKAFLICRHRKLPTSIKEEVLKCLSVLLILF